MPKTDKKLKNMRLNPNDWRIEDVETIAKKHGITIRKSGGGSHVILDHPKCVDLLSIPSRRPIKPIYIKKFISFIERLTPNE